MSNVLTALQTLLDNGLPEKAVEPIVNDLFESAGWEDDDDKKLCALLAHRAKWEDDVDCDIETIHNDDCYFRAGSNEYLVLDEDERESKWDDALENYLDECVEGADGMYFDREAWKRDARFDGAGHTLNPVNGAEEEYGCNGEWFWIYRQS